jgi:hypothetical protein
MNKTIRNTAFLLGMLVAVPAMGLAQTPAQTPATKPAAAPAAKPAATKPVKAAKATTAKAEGVHATKGVVKSVDASSLVITGSGAKAKELTFVLNSATVKTGTPAVGATVQVRYKTEAKQNIATAVSVSAAKK